MCKFQNHLFFLMKIVRNIKTAFAWFDVFVQFSTQPPSVKQMSNSTREMHTKKDSLES